MKNELINIIKKEILTKTSELYNLDIGIADEFLCSSLQAQLKYEMGRLQFAIDMANKNISIEKVTKAIKKQTKGKGETYVNSQEFINKAATAARNTFS